MALNGNRDKKGASNSQAFIEAIEAGRNSGIDKRPLKQIFKDAKQKTKNNC